MVCLATFSLDKTVQVIDHNFTIFWMFKDYFSYQMLSFG